jgi:hypothetical protein
MECPLIVCMLSNFAKRTFPVDEMEMVENV